MAGARPRKVLLAACGTALLLGHDPHRTDTLAAGARASGGSVFTAVPAAAATAQHRFGGPGVYRGLLPISERTDEGRGELGGVDAGAAGAAVGGAPNPWQHSVGWSVNTMPIEFRVGEGGADHSTAIARARTAYGELQRHTDVPFVRGWELPALETFALCHWPFPVDCFSYIDFRRHTRSATPSTRNSYASCGRSRASGTARRSPSPAPHGQGRPYGADRHRGTDRHLGATGRRRARPPPLDGGSPCLPGHRADLAAATLSGTRARPRSRPRGGR